MRSLHSTPPRPRKSSSSRGRARASSDESIDMVGQAFEGARTTGTFMRRWPTSLRSADSEWFPARSTVVGRTRDQFRNDPIASSAVNRKKNSAIGRGWRFSSKPNARALGITPDAARELGLRINTEWKLYANSYNFLCDAERRLNFGQMLRVQAGHLILDGEFLAQVDWAEDDEYARYKTCLRLIDPDRLSNPLGQPLSDTIRAGVEVNGRNVPIAYHIRERHPFDVGYSARTLSWIRHPRYATPFGRPNILHGFDPDRAGQTRGITRFAATLKAFRGFSRFTDATIQAATINALILGYVKSNAGPSAVSDAFSTDDMIKWDKQRCEYYEGSPIEMGEAVLPTLAYDDEIELATATKDVTSFEPFVRSIIRLIAAALGLTYEELSMDYSQTNYSSARAAMIHAWSDTVAMMGTIEAHLVKPFFVAWLEEAFDCGYIDLPAGAPAFHDAIDAYADGRWLGPGRGYIDPVKEITAAAARIEAGISTLEDECADQGKDYEEVLDQQAFEMSLKAAKGIPQAPASSASTFGQAQPASGGTPPEDQKPAPSALASAHRMMAGPDYDAAIDARPAAA